MSLSSSVRSNGAAAEITLLGELVDWASPSALALLGVVAFSLEGPD